MRRRATRHCQPIERRSLLRMPYKSNVSRVSRKIEDLWSDAHHAAGDVETRLPRQQPQIVAPQPGMQFVRVAEHCLFEIAQLHCGRLRRQIRDRIAPWHNSHALMRGRQEIAVPHLRPRVRRQLAQCHVRRQIGVLGPQPVAQPRSDAWQRNRRRSGVHRQRGLRVLDDIAVQSAQHAQVVGPLAQMRKEFADFEPRFAVMRERKRRRHEGPLLDAANVVAIDRLSLVRLELRFMVERVDVRKAPREKNEDQLLGATRMMSPPRSQRIAPVCLGRKRQRLIKPISRCRQSKPSHLKEPATWHRIMIRHRDALPPQYSVDTVFQSI